MVNDPSELADSVVCQSYEFGLNQATLPIEERHYASPQDFVSVLFFSHFPSSIVLSISVLIS